MSETLVKKLKEPCVVMVGRPNVGKSTLFNRLVGERKAVVSPMRGTTRDRLYGEVVWRGAKVQVIDAGGYDTSQQDPLQSFVQKQLKSAIDEADVLLFIANARDGVLADDTVIVDALRKSGKPIIMAINKCENNLAVPPEFFEFGIEDAFAISALHGLGVGDVLDRMLEHLDLFNVKQKTSPVARKGRWSRTFPEIPSLAILGRQNVGKSSLFNAILNEERVIVSDVPGTTRDAVDTWVSVGDRKVLLIDTAGLRHRRKVRQSVDVFSMARSTKSIQRCAVALLVIDATQGVTRDDMRIVTQVIENGRGLVLVVNKWDLIEGTAQRAFIRKIQNEVPFLHFAPILIVSAKEKYQVTKPLTVGLKVYRHMLQRIPVDELRGALREAWKAHPPPRIRGRRLGLKRANFIPEVPGRIELVTSPTGQLALSYQNYLIKRLAKDGRLSGVPLHFVVKGVDEIAQERREAFAEDAE